MEKAIRVLVANRPRMMRELILATFADQRDIEIVGEIANDEEIPKTVERTMPDLVVVALEQRDRSSFSPFSAESLTRMLID